MNSRRSIPGLAALALTLGLTLFAAPAAMAQDTTPPTLVSATVDGATLTQIYSEELDEDSVPGASAFRVNVAGVGFVGLAASDPVSIRGDAVTLTLAAPVAGGQRVQTRYWGAGWPWSDGKLRDVSGNKVETTPVTRARNLAGLPGAPTGVTVTGASGGSLLVSWTAPAGSVVTDYDIRYVAGSADPADDADWIEPGEPGGHDHAGTATTATIRGLTPSTAYRVQVRGVNGNGGGPWSASGSGTTNANHAPRLVYVADDGTCKVRTDAIKRFSW